MLNDYVLSILLGIVEGLTEFLPVSSTAHLRIVEKLCQDNHWASLNFESGYWKMYSVVIQLGAILCLPVYFWPRIRKFIGNFPRGERGERNIFNHPLTLTMLAFVVTAGPTYFLTKKIAANLDNFNVIGSALLIGGVVMWAVDTIFNHPTTLHMEEMSLPQAVWIGAAQILAGVFPGTSRSMCTIAAGQTAGMDRPSALEFSFFLSIPTMFAATLFAFKKAVFPKAGSGEAFNPGTMNGHDWIVLAIGFAVSFIVAFGVVAWFMSWVRRRGFTPFAIYRIIVGIAVLLWARRAA